MTVTHITPCQKLFSAEAKDLFKDYQEPLVNKSLEIFMRVVDYLVLQRPEALFLFDPAAFNNQCHLYSLMVASAVYEKKKEKTVAESSEDFYLQDRIIEVRDKCLYLCFFLSYAFLNDPKLLVLLMEKTMREIPLSFPASKKEFIHFVKDPQGNRKRAARLALNRLFEEEIKKEMNFLDTPLGLELKKLARENLYIESSDGKNFPLYTFPKFAGVLYLTERVSREQIPLLFKVKIITREGVGRFCYSHQDIKNLDPSFPVIVFEMIGAGENLSPLECQERAKRCFFHSQRNLKSKDRHKSDESCLFCSVRLIDTTFYQKRFEPAFERIHEMLLALGADFVLQKQASFLPFFSDPEKFPLLTELFQKSIPQIEPCFLSMKEPLHLSVLHVQPDSVEKALESHLIIDADYETHMKQRGLL